MQLLVFSDLHILDKNDPIYQKLLERLKNKISGGDILVFAGDIFDLFIGGKKIFRARYQDFFEILSTLKKKGVEIHYIEGNHDFLMKNIFCDGRLYARDFELTLEGKKFYFAHGDLVKTNDLRYRMVRSFLRSSAMKGFVYCAPDGLVDWIGKNWSRHSRTGKIFRFEDMPQDRAEKIRLEFRNFASEKIKQGFDFVVMGHCHDKDEMVLSSGEKNAQYINMGYPKVHGSYLTWSPGDPLICRENFG